MHVLCHHRRGWPALTVGMLVAGSWHLIASIKPGVMTLRIHLALMQPAGYIHSQGFLDQARYARHHFRRLGAEVTIAKNRLREDSVNIIFGAHLGFSASLKDRYTCVFFNLEQLGKGGATVTEAYLNLLRTSPTIDYDERNLRAYGRKPGEVPVVSFAWAPYLAQKPPLPLTQRPIDLLFFGSINERRLALFSRIEACGWSVSRFDQPLYGEERDEFIRQSKAVFNCHFYESSRFEQARAFHTLSLGTPVISERTARTTPPAAFEDAVTWVTDDRLESFFREEFMRPAWQAKAEKQLQNFACTDVDVLWDAVHAHCTAVWSREQAKRTTQVWRPSVMNLGSGKDYKLGWLNVDILERAQPDLLLDLGQPVTLPLQAKTQGGGQVQLEANSLDGIYANNVLEHVPDLPCLMTNLLALLKEEGQLEVEVPYEQAPSAWQDPTHLRAMNKNSWLYYTGWFWYLGWFENRFELTDFRWLNAQLEPCNEGEAAFMKVNLKKVSTTPHERAIARTMQSDFGGIPSDMPAGDSYVRIAAAANATPAEPVISVTDLTQATPQVGPDLDWLETLPARKNVLSIGPEAERLREAYLSRNPDARWYAPDAANVARASASAPYDLLVIGPSTAADPSLAGTLRGLQQLLAPEAVMSLALGNASAQSVIHRLEDCDTTRDMTRDSDLSGRETPAHVYKALLDAGWSPSMKAYRPLQPAKAATAQSGKLKRASDLITTMECLFIEAHRDLQDLARRPGKAAFTVVVPCTQEHQLKTNVEASSGLKEVNARVVAIRGAQSPAHAVSDVLQHVNTEWILLAHQDVYFPQGFGEQLNAVLAEIPPGERATRLIGFAGIALDLQSQQSKPSGYLIDRLSRFDQPSADTAISLDEFAVVFHRDSVHAIDPGLGWHLWATDLCLTSIKQHKTFPHIVRMPIFHNSRTGWTLPPAFRDSASALLQKHSEFPSIPTLCGNLNAEFLANQVSYSH